MLARNPIALALALTAAAALGAIAPAVAEAQFVRKDQNGEVQTPTTGTPPRAQSSAKPKAKSAPKAPRRKRRPADLAGDAPELAGSQPGPDRTSSSALPTAAAAGGSGVSLPAPAGGRAYAPGFASAGAVASAARPEAAPTKVVGFQRPGDVFPVVYTRLDRDSFFRVVTALGRGTRIEFPAPVKKVVFTELDRFTLDTLGDNIVLRPGCKTPEETKALRWETVRPDLFVMTVDGTIYNFEVVVNTKAMRGEVARNGVVYVNVPTAEEKAEAAKRREAERLEDERRAEERRQEAERVRREMAEAERRAAERRAAERDAALRRVSAEPIASKARREGPLEFRLGSAHVVDGAVYVKIEVRNRGKEPLATRTLVTIARAGAASSASAGRVVDFETTLAGSTLAPGETRSGVVVFPVPENAGPDDLLLVSVQGLEAGSDRPTKPLVEPIALARPAEELRR